MSGYVDDKDYWNQNPNIQESYNFEMPPQQELHFESFETDGSQRVYQNQNIYGANPYLNPNASYGGNIFTPSPEMENFGKTNEFDDEPPLLEELGINPDFIVQKELQLYLDSANDGLIYFSLGSNVKCNFIPKWKLDTILEVFAELPYKVLWKFDSDEKIKAGNVRSENWLPQQDILRHPNVKLFITQGGLQSVDEAIRFKVPLLGIPFFGDQFHNVKKIKHLGIGLEINFEEFSKEVFLNAIVEIVSNNTYRSRIEELSGLVGDQPVKPLDKAIWWIEYVIRHKGAQHLQSPAVHMPFYQYYLLDVIAFLFAIFLCFAYVAVRFIKLIRSACTKLLARSKKTKLHKTE